LADDIRSHESISIRKDGDMANKCRHAVTSKHEYASKPEDDNSSSFLNLLSKQLEAFYLFSRPHTVIGTVSDSTHAPIDKKIGFLLRDNRKLNRVIKFFPLLFVRLQEYYRFLFFL
jgi:hypothetical protein